MILRLFIGVFGLVCLSGVFEGCREKKKPSVPIENLSVLDTSSMLNGKPAHSGNSKPVSTAIQTGADRIFTEYKQLLEGKRLAVVANHTARVGCKTHLIDSMLTAGFKVVKVFSPEHGFRGDADAGAKVADSKDAKTGLPIISLYGNNKKPTAAQLEGVDMVVFDIQDVGTRHYTYISTMTYMMETCAELQKPMVILDRPNPNGQYVEGPLMQTAYTSFIGMHPIPIVHGMTIGEYAKMANGEKWIKATKECPLTVIPCVNYTHKTSWTQTKCTWIPPSPNLGSLTAAQLYPILCWFEATDVSVGRGTHEAFTMLGAPWFNGHFPDEVYGLLMRNEEFTPVSIPGKSQNPPFMNQKCKGVKIAHATEGKNLFLAGIYLLKTFYDNAAKNGKAATFFKANFEKWAGNTTLKAQIIGGKTPEEIYDSWQKEIAIFKTKRESYLLY